MAVRDDFTAGEVLAAADLNDTFASKPPFAYGTATPSTTVEGFIWYDENDTPPTAKFWDGSAFENIAAPSGLSIVTPTSIANSGGTATASGGAVTLTGVTSVSLNGVFTSTYQNYRIVINLVSSIANEIRFRMRASGTDDTGANYAIQYLFAAGSASTAARQTGQTAAWFFSGNGTYEAVGAYDIGSPQLAKQTTLVGSQVYDQSTLGLISWAANHDESTAYDGITIIAGSGTTTGLIRVYGYQD
jgi:hypothetical protein